MELAQISQTSEQPLSNARSSAIRSRLKAVPLLATLDDSALDALAAVARVRTYDVDEVLFIDGDRGDEVFAIVSGEVAFHLTNASGARVHLESACEGDLFGEVAVLTGGKRTATATARAPTVALTISRDVLLPLLRTHPDTLLALYADTARRLGRTSGDLRRTTVQDPKRLTQDALTPGEKRLHRAARFCGSLSLAVWTAVITALWIALLFLLKRPALEGPAFNLLALLVPVEGVVITCIVLHSQHLQEKRERVRDEVEFRANLRAEMELLNLHEKVDALAADLRGRPRATEGDGLRAVPARTEGRIDGR